MYYSHVRVAAAATAAASCRRFLRLRHRYHPTKPSVASVFFVAGTTRRTLATSATTRTAPSTSSSVKVVESSNEILPSLPPLKTIMTVVPLLCMVDHHQHHESLEILSSTSSSSIPFQLPTPLSSVDDYTTASIVIDVIGIAISDSYLSHAIPLRNVHSPSELEDLLYEYRPGAILFGHKVPKEHHRHHLSDYGHHRHPVWSHPDYHQRIVRYSAANIGRRQQRQQQQLQKYHQWQAQQVYSRPNRSPLVVNILPPNDKSMMTWDEAKQRKETDWEMWEDICLEDDANHDDECDGDHDGDNRCCVSSSSPSCNGDDNSTNNKTKTNRRCHEKHDGDATTHASIVLNGWLWEHTGGWRNNTFG